MEDDPLPSIIVPPQLREELERTEIEVCTINVSSITGIFNQGIAGVARVLDLRVKAI